jgi:PTS system cellobiose-specific IIC component
MTMGLIAVFVVFMIAYNYSKSLGLRPMQNGIMALVSFLFVSAPIQTVTLADGALMTVMETSYLGGAGIFVAILVSLIAVRISNFCVKKNIIIKMPDVVPAFLSESFSAMLPLFFNVLLWHGIGALLSVFTGGQMTLPLLINYVLSIPLGAVNSVPGMLLVSLFASLLWTFGIHGSMVAYIALMGVMIQNVSMNAAAVAAGNEPIFYATILFGATVCAGGTGNTLGLVIWGLLRGKSEQIKAVSKSAIIPGIFNINEPVVFGYPIMYNPLMAIPYILVPLITMVLVWIGFAIGFFQPTYINLMALMPLFVGEFLTSLAWQNLFIPVVGLVVGLLVYYPFFRVYDNQLVEQEAAAKEAATEQA